MKDEIEIITRQGDPLENLEILELPVIPLRDLVIFPNMVVPLFVGRDMSLKALEHAEHSNGKVLLLTQKNYKDDNLNSEDLYSYGIVSDILQKIQMNDETKKVLIRGDARAKVIKLSFKKGMISAVVEIQHTEYDIKETTMEATRRELLRLFEEFLSLSQKNNSDIMQVVNKLNNVEQLADVILSHVVNDPEIKQISLEEHSLKKKLKLVLREIADEIEILKIEKSIQGKVKSQIDKNQKEYYLHEQQKIIAQELGDSDTTQDIEKLEKSIKNSKMSDEAKHKALQELKKLSIMPALSSEGAIISSYIEYLLSLPWKKYTKLNNDLKKAQEQLDADHYGLEKIKDIILEYLAVNKRNPNSKSPILCFVGPPGVGKTSLGRSIAVATKRKYIRIALGGVNDESEIRGHRKTYIGAMPGKIMQSIAKSNSSNALVLLDEIDKLGKDHRGDPAAALLEVLDPEQRSKFVDHYTEVGFDLSGFMFVCTANSISEIPWALRDRMEIVKLNGYTELEKIQIAEQHLIRKQMKDVSLKKQEISLDEDVVVEIIRCYTSEAGVRNLERQINKICRKVLKEIDQPKGPKTIAISKQNLIKYLGEPKYEHGIKSETNRIGRVTGLAWTEVGGEILTIEVLAVPGKGQFIFTGNLGNVMKESIQTAISLIRSRSDHLSLDVNFYEKKDLHIHVPEAATPKDGPSAGTAMVIAILSALTLVPVKADIAMTGECSLYGEVLAIGGLKEKLLAAMRAKITHVLIPEKNKHDLNDLPEEIKKGLKITLVKNIDEVLDLALESNLYLLNNQITPQAGITDNQVIIPSSEVKHHAKPRRAQRI